MFHAFIHLLRLTICQQVVYQFDASCQNFDNWVFDSLFSSCKGQQIFGRQNMSSALMRNFELPPHYSIQIDLTFYRIDSWDLDKFLIYLDNQVIYEQAYTSTAGSDLCGGTSANVEIIQISVQAYHNSHYAVVYLKAIDVNGDNNESWGIQSFKLSIQPCPYGCDYCEPDQLFNCKKWQLSYLDQKVTNYYYYNNSLYQYFYYSSNFNQYAITLPKHNKIMMRFGLIIRPSQSLNVNILINNQQYSSTQISNSLSFQTLFNIILPLFNHRENQITIQFYRIGGSQIYFDFKELQLFTQNDDEQQQFIQGCVSIIQNTCWECETGWLLVNEYQNYEQAIILDLFEQQCIPNCGDFLIVGSEQCEDGNDIPYDGCYQCQFQCNPNCALCIFGICQQCQQEYFLTSYKTCEPICGDGIIVPYIESCDDKNNDQGDGCYSCQLECFEDCIKCNAVFCFQCSIGFQLIQNQCIPVCGDQIVLSDIEECDDGNDVEYDGCYECKYQCQNKCQNCEKGVCIDQCQQGQIMVNQMCISVCGNSIVTEQEECDDENDIQYDGCYQCNYSCPLYCDYCVQGVCLECQQNFVIFNNQCQSIETCGDGLVSDQEDCDDGNTAANDGCYKCQIEENWTCKDINPSQCQFMVAPKIIVSILNYTAEIQYLQLSFSQKVKLQHNFQPSLEELIKLKIINISEEDSNITIYSIIPITINLSQALYDIQILITQPITNNPYLQIELDDDIVNENGISLFKKTSLIQLHAPNYINPQQKQAAQKLLKINSGIIYCLAVACVISIILSEQSIFQDILNALQYVSLLKFINLDYPENLVIFFEFSDLVSISPLLNLLPIDSYLNKIYQEQAMNTIGKFAFYSQETNLISNLICQFLQITGYVILFLCLWIFKKLIFSNQMIAKYINCMSYLTNKLNQKFVFLVCKYFYKFIKIIGKCSIKFTLQVFHYFLLLNGWDIIFKLFLYVSSIQQRPSLDYVQLILSILISIAYATVILVNLTKILYFKSKTYKYQLILEIINLIRQIMFLSVLVFFQNSQVLQTISILLITLAYVLIINSLQTHFKLLKNYIQHLVEVIVVLFTLTSIAHFEDLKKNEDYKILVGFIQIGILSSCMVAILLDYSLKKVRQITQTIIKKK